jgi:hypothetical protein
MKKILFLALILTAAILSGCKKEYAMPVVEAPGSEMVEVGKAIDLTFSFSAEGGYKSSTLTATGGTAAIKTNATAGAESGEIVVTFTAGTTVGAGAVVITVMDNEGQTETATAVLSIYEEGAPMVTAPSSTNVTVTKTVDLTFAFTSEGGYKSSAVTATGGTVVIKTNATAGAASGNVVVTFTAGRNAGAGSVTITMTDNNNKTAQSIGVLNVESFPTISVTGNITTNTTWETGKIYILEGRIAVLSGATLTIQPGTIIKGREGSASNATALLIARGGKIEAVGTSTSPIIFTSVADQILPGEIISPNLAPTVNGLWGGLLVLGKAPISAAAEAVQIEGIPVSDLNGLYGGTDAADNSGTLKYISIRHGGANIGEGNEINGLTLGGVGSGTVIENIEVVANQDDGIEWFGGTVNVKNALIWNPGDDCVDTDQAWAGTLENFMIICGDLTDHALEIDGPEGTMLAAHTVKNGSVKGNPTSELGDFRSGARGTFQDIYFFNFPDPATAGYGDFSLSGQASLDNFAGGILNFSNLQINPVAGVALTSIFKNGTHVHATSVTTPTTGADKTKFTGWTWADKNNQLTSF